MAQKSFNPRTHTGCDTSEVLYFSRSEVSIHAPTRGATTPYANTNDQIEFQSTHPHGVRLPVLLGLPIVSLFQSTHPHGVRLNACQKAIHQFIVSIHAPTRGATPFCHPLRLSRALFQSTHPHGVRLAGVHVVLRHSCFNPRTHTGCDSNERGLNSV